MSSKIFTSFNQEFKETFQWCKVRALWSREDLVGDMLEKMID